MTDPDIAQELANILRPLQPQRHQDTDRLEQETMAWFDRQNLPDLQPGHRVRLRSSQFSAGVGAAFPSASYPAAYWWSRFTLWYMTFEDTFAESTAAHNLPQYMHTAGESWILLHHTTPPGTPSTPTATILTELLHELDTVAPDLVASRIRQALRDYLFAAGWEAATRVADKPITSAQYRSFRRHSSLIFLNIEYIEQLPGLLLTEQERKHPAIRELRALACDIIGDINDLYSINVEIANDNALLPDNAAQADRVDQYFHDVIDLCQTQIATFLDVTNSLAAFPKLYSYATAVKQWVAGTAWWHHHARTHRYHIERP